VTAIFSNSNVKVTDCSKGSSTCAMTGDYAHKDFDPNTTKGINEKRIVSNLDIDYWETSQASKLTVSNIKLAGRGDFKSTCGPAYETPLEELTPELLAALGQ